MEGLKQIGFIKKKSFTENRKEIKSLLRRQSRFLRKRKGQRETVTNTDQERSKN